MRKLSFGRGLELPHHKELTEKQAIRQAREPRLVVIHLSQHLGAPCLPLVQQGSQVEVGQKLGDSDARVSAPVHASVSGQVVAVEPRQHPVLGRPELAVVIEADGEGRVHAGIQPPAPIEELDGTAVRSIIRAAGLVGLGGAAFPTAVKVSPPPDKPIDTFILNGAECEPFLTGDYRLMVEEAPAVVLGMKALMKAIPVTRGYIGIEDDKPEAVSALMKAVRSEPGLEVVVLKTRYPQGAEKQLVKAVLGRRVPPPPGLPLDVGVVVNNVGTAHALAVALRTGLPLVERVVTVTGTAIGAPGNLRVKLGTLFSDLIAECGGYSAPPGKLIMGGPMMGIAQHTDEVPVVKGTSGILALVEDEAWHGDPTPCVRCARCVDACPMELLPVFISAYAERGQWEASDSYHAVDCIECGSCSYICPARRPLVQTIRLAKNQILARRRKAEGG
ncbi:MAG TPA: electron transport complex subunit RsxC [Clostridiales bacterium UBA8153]|nr:electron transport complex subunit RsxC [Clostridiales bacterium UBA8153]